MSVEQPEYRDRQPRELPGVPRVLDDALSALDDPEARRHVRHAMQHCVIAAEEGRDER